MLSLSNAGGSYVLHELLHSCNSMYINNPDLFCGGSYVLHELLHSCNSMYTIPICSVSIVYTYVKQVYTTHVALHNMAHALGKFHWISVNASVMSLTLGAHALEGYSSCLVCVCVSVCLSVSRFRALPRSTKHGNYLMDNW